MLRSFLAEVYPLLLCGLLFAWTCLLIKVRGDFSRLFRDLGGSATWGGLALSLAAFLLARSLHTPGHRVFEDEFEHIDIAQNVLRMGTFGESLAAGRPGHEQLELPTWPGLHHAALAAAFLALEPTEETAYLWSGLLGAASVLLLFLLTLTCFQSRAAAFAAAWVLALHPLHLRYSAAADTTPISAACLLIYLLSLRLLAETKSPLSYAFSLASLLLAMHARFENALLAPLGLLYLHRQGVAHPKGRRLVLSVAVFCVMMFPITALVVNNHRQNIPGFGANASETLASLISHLPGNIAFLVSGPGGPPVLFLTLSGLALLPRRHSIAAISVTGAFLLAFSAFFRGDFAAQSQNRYAMITVLPLLPLAGGGFLQLWRRHPALKALAIAAITLAPPLNWPHYGGREKGGFADEADFLRRAAELLPPSACIVSFSVPLARLAGGRCAVSPVLLLESPSTRSWEQEWGPLAFLEDQWARLRVEDTAALKRRFSERWTFELVARMDGAGAALWRLSPKIAPIGRYTGP